MNDMLATERDRQIVLLIGRFKQLAAGHIHELLFADVSSRTPLDRALLRLVNTGFIARIERRLIGGSGAGSGQYVYQLGPKGWRMTGREDRYWAMRSVDYHSLATADAYVALRKAERDGLINVITYETEPDTWREIAGSKLTPDLYVELSVPKQREYLSLWIEVDMGTERQKQMKDKFLRYWHAYQHSEGGIYPLVVFVVPDAQRAYDVKRWIATGPDEARALFDVVELANFPSVLI